MRNFPNFLNGCLEIFEIKSKNKQEKTKNEKTKFAEESTPSEREIILTLKVGSAL
jgi:hypothetical protein